MLLYRKLEKLQSGIILRLRSTSPSLYLSVNKYMSKEAVLPASIDKL